MPVRDTAWPVGTPCWVDLMTTDPEAARAFYGALFDWTFEVGPPEVGGYAIAARDGHNVAGITAMPEMEPGHPPVWSTYLATTDAAATAQAVEAGGGSIVTPVMSILDLGSMGFGQAPGGGVFGYWQAGAHTGFQLANDTGSVVWNEFLTRDVAAAQAFYTGVFGYTYTDMSSDGFTYAMVEVDGNVVGGIGSLPAEVSAQVPPHWRVYFAVDDADAAVEHAVSLGGAVLRPPADMPYGRHADLADPQGAAFAIIKPAPGM